MNEKEDAKQDASLTFKRKFGVQVQKYWKYTRKWFPFAIFIGAISGVIMSLFTSLVFIVQRLIIDSPTALTYLLYPVVGGITSLFMFFGFKEVYGAGLSHVLAHKNTTTPLRPRGILTKFFTSLITLGIGAPGGREGPAVTIGSTASSVIGNKIGMTQEDEMHAITIDFQSGFAKDKELVEDVMTKNVITAYPDETLSTAFDKLTKFRIESMPVVERENNKVILGIISFRDIENRYETALTKLQSRRKLTIEEIEDDI